ncbi:MAG: ferredoxin [Actinomycetota bacterium]|nr:ferredoxin [Actinomycetota bacterium]
MHVTVDYELCESNGICAGLVPSVFDLRDDDMLYLLDDSPSEDLRQQVERASRRCPRQAIRVEG